jgi:ABC-type branched-subunit amino acid transport system permease subunit
MAGLGGPSSFQGKRLCWVWAQTPSSWPLSSWSSGGLGSLLGALIGALIVGVMRTVGIMFFPEIELAVLYLIAAVVLLVRPTGLFGVR